MTGSEYIAEILRKNNVTDVFGIPGAVILELLYAFDRHGPRPHLCYHEQSAGFAACGYAQAKNSLGVAYATKGPGFTNLISAIADAYYDSIPVLFITAHSSEKSNSFARYMQNQELGTVPIVSNITKSAEYIETGGQLLARLERACAVAMENRKGPVLLDFNSKVFEEDILNVASPSVHEAVSNKHETDRAIKLMAETIGTSKRPVVLIGNGVKQSKKLDNLEQFCQKSLIPILSSRAALDCFADSDSYFGYIGSRGLRYSNFILGKCDVIVSIGNRMAYNLGSESFKQVMQEKKVIRIEIDENEFERKIPNAENIICDLEEVLKQLECIEISYPEPQKWMQTCIKLREQLCEFDINEPVRKIIDILRMIPEKITLICDVGNNALWFSRAHSYLKSKNKVLFSMGFACLGNALCKSIGAVYADGQFTVCIIGDQGIQMNIQELEFLSKNKVPVLIILINNHSSGMICNWEKQKYGYDLHCSLESGYGIPDFAKAAQAYSIDYIEYSGPQSIRQALGYCKNRQPVLLDVSIDPSEKVLPSLRKGNPCYKMTPEIPSELYESLLEL